MFEEWKTEPDSHSWVHNGYACHIQRMNRSKALNGYVAIPAGHPLHNVEYCAPLPASIKALNDEVMSGPAGGRSPIQLFTMSADSPRAGDQFDVHGGVTYSGVGYWLPKSGDQGFWYGFDCSHHGDLSPGYDFTRRHANEYRNIAFVTAECESFADQLAHAQSITGVNHA